MQLITDPSMLQNHHGGAFVPTMGALHAGHLSLIKHAAQFDSPVVVSIFVNPEQFAPQEDFEKYPRDLERDTALAFESGADVVFAPSTQTVYPDTPSKIDLPSVATQPRLEDAWRPGHFQGVCQVLTRLFDLVKPAVAVFGEKDYQQFLVVKQLVKQTDCWGKLHITCAPIIREEDGLALSSRNVYLSKEERLSATCLHKAIQCSNEEDMRAMIDDAGLTIEYAVIRDAQTLLGPEEHKPKRSLVVARAGNTRLLDNGVVAL